MLKTFEVTFDDAEVYDVDTFLVTCETVRFDKKELVGPTGFKVYSYDNVYFDNVRINGLSIRDIKVIPEEKI